MKELISRYKDFTTIAPPSDLHSRKEFSQRNRCDVSKILRYGRGQRRTVKHRYFIISFLWIPVVTIYIKRKKDRFFYASLEWKIIIADFNGQAIFCLSNHEKYSKSTAIFHKSWSLRIRQNFESHSFNYGEQYVELSANALQKFCKLSLEWTSLLVHQ